MNALLQRALQAWNELQPRERTTLRIGAAFAAVVLVFGGAWLVESRLDAQANRIEQLRRDTMLTQLATAEILAAGPAQAGAGPPEPLIVLTDRLAREAGLREALTATETTADGALRITFRGVSFDMLVGMLYRIAQQYGVAIREARIDNATEAGRINATLVFSRPADSRPSPGRS